jgi:hypothetical protein
MRLTRYVHPAESFRNDRGDFLPGRGSFRAEPEARELAFQTIRDLHELEALRAIWKSWPGTRDSDLDFFSGVVRSRGRGCRPHVILLTRNTRPDAILVGLRERRKLPFRMGCFTICEPEVNVLEFVSGGLRGNASEENCAAFVRQAMRSLDEGDADMALWENLDVQSPLYKCAHQWPRFALRDHFPCIDDHWWLRNFPKGLDAFFMSLSRSQRSKLRRKYKNVLARFQGKAQVRCFRSLADLESAIADMEEIASKTDKRRVFGLGFFDTPQVREQMAVAAERGWLRIYILYLEQKPAAFWRGTVYGHCLQGDHVGYDPVWREFSPGIFLFLNILESLRDDDIKSIDFGYGNTQFKQCLGDLRRLESRLHIYAPTLRGILLNLLHTTTPCATHCAKFLLQRARCLEWARRASRNQLAHQHRQHHPIVGNSGLCNDKEQVRRAAGLMKRVKREM